MSYLSDAEICRVFASDPEARARRDAWRELYVRCEEEAEAGVNDTDTYNDLCVATDCAWEALMSHIGVTHTLVVRQS